MGKLRLQSVFSQTRDSKEWDTALFNTPQEGCGGGKDSTEGALQKQVETLIPVLGSFPTDPEVQPRSHAPV